MYHKPHSQQQVYPEDIECVIDPINGKGGVFLGNLEASENLRTLTKHGIGAVLTAAKSIKLNHPKTHVPHHLHILGEDHQRFDLSIYFDQAANFIEKTREQTNLLVHCMAGVSRSVTLLIAYLIKKKGMSYNDSYTLLKRRRRIINPNSGFIKQLHDYERKVRSCANQGASNSAEHAYYSYETRHQRMSPDVSEDPYANMNYNPRTSKLFDDSWNKGNIYAKHQPSHYYDSMANRKKRHNFTQNYRDFTLNESRKVNEPRQNPETTVDHSKYRATNQSFEDLNRQLDKRIADIRQKYSDIAQQTTGNNRLKEMLVSRKRPDYNKMFNDTVTHEPTFMRKSMSVANRYSNYGPDCQNRNVYKREVGFSRDCSKGRYLNSEFGGTRGMGRSFNYYDY